MKNAITRKGEKKLAMLWGQIVRDYVQPRLILIPFVRPLLVVRPHFRALGLETLWTSGFEYKYFSFSLGFSHLRSDFVIASNLISLLVYMYFPTRRSEVSFFLFLIRKCELLYFCFSIKHLPLGNYVSFCISQEEPNESEFKMCKCLRLLRRIMF